MDYPNQVIFLVDLDCFFASVAILENPELKGLPVIIGADPKKGKGRGVVTTCSYEARKYGVHSAMPISQAYRLCPHGQYVKADFSKIRDKSHQVMNILKSYSDVFQQTSIDEAYLDCTEICSNFKEAETLALKIKNQVQEDTGKVTI